MLRKGLSLVAGLAIGLTSVSFATAADEAPAKKPGAAGRDPARLQEAIKKFDKDGDGKLNDAERAEAMKARGGKPGAGGPGGRPDPAKMQELMKKFDKDGDGKLSDTEREAAKGEFAKLRGAAGERTPNPERTKAIIAKFDKDGDGKLNETEKAEAMKARGNAPAGGKPRPKPDNK